MTRVSGNSTSAVFVISRKVYATSLVLYPNELRREFGAEMVEVFDELVAEAYSRSGFSGLLHVWFSAAREFVTVALPGQLAEHMVRILGVTATLALMVWFAGYVGYVMQTACPSCGR